MADNPEHWDSAVNLYCFAKLPEQLVSVEVRQRAQAMSAFVISDLNISRPIKTVWVRPVGPQTARLGPRRLDYQEESHANFARCRMDIEEGFTPGSYGLHEIWIRSNLDSWPNLENVIAHELRHAWQKLYTKEVFKEWCRSEADAYS